MLKQFNFKQFSLGKDRFSSIWPRDRPLSGAASPGQSGPLSDGNKGILGLLQSSSITEASPSDCLVSYPGHSLGMSYPSVEMQSVYSTSLANWAIEGWLNREKRRKREK